MSKLVARPPIHPASFDKLDPDRFNEIYLYNDKSTIPGFRYKLTVVDRRILPTTTTCLSYATAVFLIPAGRESEFLFTSKKGLLAIAESAQTARIVAVSFGRMHEYASQAACQEELTFVVQLLSRQGQFLTSSGNKTLQSLNTTAIPFMALDGIGQRDIIAHGESDLSGKFLVEQVLAEGKQVRRLYFLENPFVIQSEVLLKDLANDGDVVIDKSHAAFEYHKTIVAGLGTLLLSPLSSTIENNNKKGLMIGLGGGGLVNLFQHVFPTRVSLTAVELDPVIAQVAQEHFGLKEHTDSGYLTVTIGDGLHVMTEKYYETSSDIPRTEAVVIDSESISFVIIDVDSKDKTVGMSCPPQSFVDPVYLERLASVMIQADGMLVINVSARDPSMMDLVCRNVSSVFATVILSKHAIDVEEVGRVEEDLNVVVFASRQELDLPPTSILLDRLKTILHELDSPELVAELETSIESLRAWSPDSSGQPKKQMNGKKKKKKKKGKGR